MLVPKLRFKREDGTDWKYNGYSIDYSFSLWTCRPKRVFQKENSKSKYGRVLFAA